MVKKKVWMLHQYVYEWTDWVYEKETNKTLLFIDICINLRYVYLKSHFCIIKKRKRDANETKLKMSYKTTFEKWVSL